MAEVAAAEVAAAHWALLDRVVDLDDVAVAGPSRLPGWTVGHVLSHIALNAEAFTGIAVARREGRDAYMYPGGQAARNDAIEAAAGRSATDVVAHLQASAAAYDEAWATPVPEGSFGPWAGLPRFSTSEIPLRRLREVEVHGTDTTLPAFGTAAWSPAYVDADLPTQWATVTRRTEHAVHVIDDAGRSWRAGDGDTTQQSVLATDLLAWLLDRTQPAGLPTLAPWGDPTTWRPVP